MCSTIAMAPGSSLHPHNAMKNKEGGQRESSQEVVASGSMGLFSEVNVNRMLRNDPSQQSRPALSKTMLPPPKNLHHPVNQNTSGQPFSRNAYMNCEEKSENSRGGSLTSRISCLSPGTKRKMLGYAADGSIPPLPPRQKRVKKGIKLSSGEGKLSTKFARLAEPSGLLGDLKPGIMRQQTRSRTEIHALLSAVVGDLLQRSSLSAVDGLFYDTKAHGKFSAEIDGPLTECSDLNWWIEQASDQPADTDLQESLDGSIDLPKAWDQSITDLNSRFADAFGPFEMGPSNRPCQSLINTIERTSGFVPFQRFGLHACNSNVPTLAVDSGYHIPVVSLRDLTDHNHRAQLPVNMNQEHDTILISSRGACVGEAFECKQEEFEDTCEYPFDLSTLNNDGGSLRHENAMIHQQQESNSLMLVSGANVATCWLELLSLDVKGRLSALRRSKRRVEGVIDSRELDLDAPLLPGCAIAPPNPNQHAQGQSLVDSWRNVFESMDRALSLEGLKLVLLQKSWLQQIHVMQGECQRDMTSASSLPPISFSEPTPLRAQNVQQAAVPNTTDSMTTTSSFASQSREYMKDLIM